MNIHLRIDKSDEIHTHVSVFLNHKHCGVLCVGTKDFPNLHQIISMGCVPTIDEFLSSGNFYKGKNNTYHEKEEASNTKPKACP